MRPNWQVFQARELTARAQPRTFREEGGVRMAVAEPGTPGSHMIGALIVRNLVAQNPALNTEMLLVPQTDQGAWAGADKPESFIKAMNRMWTSLGIPPTGTVDPARVAEALWTLARVAYLSLPEQEIEAAKEIAARSAPLPWYESTTVKEEAGSEALVRAESWEPPWTDEEPEPPGLDEGGVASLNAALGSFGFGSLRSEVEAATPEAARADVLRTFDTLSRDSTERHRWVKKWQEWAKAQGQYTATVDGLWGPASETAWIWLLPRSYGRLTTLADLRALTYGGIEAASVLAAGIARDKWIAANPTRLPPPPPPEPEIPATVATTETSEDDDGVTITPVSGEETVEIHPEEDETGTPPPPPPQRVEITPLPGWGPTEHVTVIPVEEGAPAASQAKAKSSWTPWLVGLGATALIVGAFVWTGKKQPYEEG